MLSIVWSKSRAELQMHKLGFIAGCGRSPWWRIGGAGRRRRGPAPLSSTAAERKWVWCLFVLLSRCKYGGLLLFLVRTEKQGGIWFSNIWRYLCNDFKVSQ